MPKRAPFPREEAHEAGAVRGRNASAASCVLRQAERGARDSDKRHRRRRMTPSGRTVGMAGRPQSSAGPGILRGIVFRRSSPRRLRRRAPIRSDCPIQHRPAAGEAPGGGQGERGLAALAGHAKIPKTCRRVDLPSREVRVAAERAGIERETFSWRTRRSGSRRSDGPSASSLHPVTDRCWSWEGLRLPSGPRKSRAWKCREPRSTGRPSSPDFRRDR